MHRLHAWGIVMKLYLCETRKLKLMTVKPLKLIENIFIQSEKQINEPASLRDVHQVLQKILQI